jgi:site-specific DNA-methyltransferase (adenine-specific)
MLSKALFSSNRMDWTTPQDFFDELDKEFHFTLDPCALPETAKCKAFFTPDDDGLKQSWAGQRVFCNPPYGREVGKWVKKCYDESMNGAVIALLIPARTDTRYFHEYIYHKCTEIRFIRGRLKFGGSNQSAPFPSMLVIYNETIGNTQETRGPQSPQEQLHL